MPDRTHERLLVLERRVDSIDTHEVSRRLEHLERHSQAIDRWRESIDEERGAIMGSLGRLSSTQQHLVDAGVRYEAKLDSILDKLEERPSRVELDQLRRGVDSIRAKAKPISRLSNLQFTYGKAKFRLGASGVTIVFALTVIVAAVTLWLLTRR